MLSKALLVCLLLLLPLFQIQNQDVAAQGRVDPSGVLMPSYVGIAKNYDNRKCVVTVSLDDFGSNTSAWQSCLSMLTRKGLYHTVGIITSKADWSFAQYWVNRGFTEAGSHSVTHFDTLGVVKVDYAWQVNFSKQEIVSHLSLPQWWRGRQAQYVYAWIDPYGRTNDAVVQSLGRCHYLVERGACAYPSADPAKWNPVNNIFEQTGISAEIGPNYGGSTSFSFLSDKFNRSYSGGGVFHLMAHPVMVNWSVGGYADRFTGYISRRADVWYVPVGLLGLYRFVSTMNVTHVSRISGKPFFTFKINIDKDVHELYGASYPITYVFKIPANWTTGYAYCRHGEDGPWKPINMKHSFNGREAARFDFSKHEAYVSVAFRPDSDNVYVRIVSSAVPRGILSES